MSPLKSPPLPYSTSGFDGRFRERQRESTAEAVLICSEDGGPGGPQAAAEDVILVPGSQSLIRVSEAQLDQVIRDKGQVRLREASQLLFHWWMG